MNPIILVIIPAALGTLTLFVRGEKRRRLRRFILIIGAILHAVGTAALLFFPPPVMTGGLLQLDALGLLFLVIVSLLFLLVAIYSLGYFQHERSKYTEEGVSHLYVPCMLFFLAAMTLTTLSDQLGVLWVAIEATTVASAPLIYYHHYRQALEAAWKYLLICSVGIAIALLGIFFVIASGKGGLPDISLPTLIRVAGTLDPHWLRLGFILALAGFGTKMGLAPFHSWLPDAHSEAPSPVSALLSGALLNCAFLGILRFYQIMIAAGLAGFANTLFILLGLVSLGVAAVFILGSRDYKRLLAYSSIEHMGILILGVGIQAPFGALLHAVNHSLAKGLLFLTAGQILILYRTKVISEVHGLLRTCPLTGILFLLGGLAIIGAPPFAPFISEFIILREGLVHDHWLAGSLYLLFLGIIFVGMSRVILGMVQGGRKEWPGGGAASRGFASTHSKIEDFAESNNRALTMTIPPMILAVFTLVFGLYLPGPLVTLLQMASRLIGGAL